jgi:uncharacterized protein with HEPN domain
MDRDQLFSDHLRLDGVLHNLHVIGEAVKKQPADLRAKYPRVPWREIAGMRDVVVHGTFALDLEILWRGVEQKVPTLPGQMRAILTAERPPE